MRLLIEPLSKELNQFYSTATKQSGQSVTYSLVVYILLGFLVTIKHSYWAAENLTGYGAGPVSMRHKSLSLGPK